MRSGVTSCLFTTKPMECQRQLRSIRTSNLAKHMPSVIHRFHPSHWPSHRVKWKHSWKLRNVDAAADAAVAAAAVEEVVTPPRRRSTTILIQMILQMIMTSSTSTLTPRRTRPLARLLGQSYTLTDTTTTTSPTNST